MSMESEHFRLMARFNAWVNTHLFEMVAGLSYDGYWEDRGLFFGSVHDTLNHILLVDRLWMARLRSRQPPAFASLADELHRDLASLRVARADFDAYMIETIDSFGADALRQPVRFSPATGDGARIEMRRDLILITLFNHQTHHRGQVHSVLTREGLAPRGLDVADFLETRKPSAPGGLRVDPGDAIVLSSKG